MAELCREFDLTHKTGDKFFQRCEDRRLMLSAASGTTAVDADTSLTRQSGIQALLRSSKCCASYNENRLS